MNNKFIKRVAAVVLGVAVLSTCAFASSITDGASYASETLNFAYTSSAEKVSYIAYAATVTATGETPDVTVGTTGYTTGNIVAVDQVDDNTAGGTVNVGINSTLLGSATHIVIMSGDSAGGEAAKAVVLTVDEWTSSSSCTNVDDNYTVVLDNGVTYTDCPVFNVNVKANAEVKVTGLMKQVGDAAAEAFTAVNNLPSNITIEAGGEYDIENIYVVGIPSTVDKTTVKIVPVIE